MKVDRAKLKKSSSEVPSDCKTLIDKLKVQSENDLYKELRDIKVWTYGKCELYHWADVLDVFDTILEKSCSKENEKKWTLSCDIEGSEQLKKLLLEVLRFTALLIEHSFSRHLYNSMDHLTTLLTSCDMSIVLYVLNLLYVFSKRSNFIARMNIEKKQGVIQRLIHLAESWGGRENGFGLAECCQDLPTGSFPSSATTLHFEFYAETKDDQANKKVQPASSTVIQSIHMENVDKSGRMPSQIMEDILEVYDVPVEKQVLLFTHIRLACLFSNYEARVHCVQARLQAISILVYSSSIQDNMNVILYPGLIEELVDIVEIEDPALVDIKSAALRTLTSVIHIERNPRLNSIIDATGASSYHGFLPVLVRTCIQHMIDPDLKPFPQTYATSLFSFLYHLANYEHGVEALVSCGMMESLLKVINWYGDGQEHITFVTRAVRVIDLITNMDMAAFQAHGGLNAFINRLEHEVNICRKEQPFVIRPHGHDLSMDANPDSPLVVPMETSTHMEEGEGEASSASADAVASTSSGTTTPGAVDGGSSSFPKQTPAEDEGAAGSSGKDGASSGNNVKALHCFAQRAALLKSMLNFLKKAIPDLSFAESIRHLMDGSLPKSLKHIISNAEYYGPSLFLLATDVVTVYVFQEPSLLSSLQDKGLTDVVLHALLIKDVPATREILASLPNVFSALCLNARGLEAFVVCKPFDSLFRVLLSPDYLPAMRRRRSSDPFGDTASNLGNAMDELMRHQPSLRADATKAIIKLLEEICIMGQDPLYICQKQPTKTDNTSTASSSSVRSPQSNEASSSDEEEEDEVEMPHMPPSFAAPAVHMAGPQVKPSSGPSTSQLGQTPERQAIPLMDYVLNVMKFVEAILSNNSTADHCREFVAQKGLKPLMSILGLPNLPIDFPSSAACQAVSSACKSVLTLSKEAEVLRGGLLQMKEVLDRLEPLHSPLEPPGGSVLLRELANAAHIPEATLSSSATPLLHALSAAHAYITMFVHVCRMGQFDIRTISVNHWGSDLGLSVLKGLSSLYNSLVWESTVLLALCNEDYLPSGCLFGKADLEKLLSKDAREKSEETMEEKDAGVPGSSDNGGADAMDTQNTLEEHMDTSESSPAHAAPAEAGNGSGLAQAQGPLVTPSASSTSIDSELLQQADSAGSGVGTSEVVGDDKENKRKLTPAMQAQLRQLKPLLTLSSRLGRALSELFVLLVKLCVGSPVRMRRSQQLHPPVMPSPPAREVALALTKLLAGGLSFQPPIDSSLAKLRMTFLVCSVGFTAPMLFDEKKHPFHLMLQKFVNCGGQDALFQSFSWALSMDGKVPLAEGLEHPDLPDGTGEFLDSWLALVEKMINTKAVLESPHVLPAKGKSPGLSNFNPVQYLISTQKAAFNAVMNLWNKKPLPVHGSRMSESVFTILCHIIKGEAIIKKHLEKEKAGAVAIAGPSGAEAVDLSGAGPSGVIAAAAAGNRLAEPAINQAHLQQLMDMGFSREQATVALTNTNSVEQATEYILSNPMPAASSSLGGAMDLTGDENDENAQMTRAIAMSLGENFLPPDQAKTEQKSDKTDEDAEEKQEGEEPLDSAVLDDFTQNIFPGCLNLLDTLPETVYRVCDLLNVVMQRNGPDWQRETLGTLCKDLCGLSEEMTSFAQDMNLDAMQNSPSAQKFATRLHLLSLLAEEMNLSCSLAMQHVNLPGRLVSLLQSSHDPMLVIGQTAGFKSTPRWLAPMLVLLDLWEKIAISLRRKMEARIAVGANRIWKWFDDSSGRWCKYSSNNNQTIDDAYRKGDSMVRFQAGRRKYSVQFSTMVQLNEETGNRRPVMLSIQTAEDRTNGKKETKDTGADEQLIEEIKKEFEVPANTVHYLPCLPHESIEIIINCLSAFLSIPLNADTLQAAMRLILRMTRQHQYAVLFVSQGGARQLLKLTLDSNFQGFLNLATLIFRHILEEPVSLRYCMEKVMRNVCAGIGSCQSGVSQGGIGAQEMHYVLRVLGPAACRDPELFTQVARDTLQIALPGPADEDETRYTGPNAPQILKCTPTKQLEALVNPSIKTFIWDLLNSLIAEQPLKTKKSINQAASLTVDQIIEDAVSKVIGQTRQSVTSPATRGALPEAGQQNKESTVSVVGGQETTTTAAYPLIPKSAILRLLSEIIRSYGNCVQLITQYYYQPGQTELVPDGCSVLAFVLDSLLPSCQTVGDKDCPALSRVFVASISSCSHSPDAQMALVTEVKAALGRALALQEGSVKHHRVQALASIINTMIEACPSPGQVPNQVFKGQQVMNNNMIKSLVKKGVLVDLARIPHSLDLSSPFLATTINYVLKPLETLSRSVNSPDKFVSVKKVGGGSGAANGSSADQGTSGTVELDQGGTTTQVVTEPPNSVTVEDAPGAVTPMPDPGEVSEMNVTIEDVTNDPEAQANLEMSSDHHISEPQSSRQMNSLLSQLLGEAGGDPEDQVLSDITIDSGRRGIISRNEHRTGEEDNDILIDVEVEVEGDDDFEAHDSQMVSQVLSDEDDDADERHPRGHDDNQDDVSGDEEDYDEAYQEETGDDDEDEEDEEDEDEDEEDTSDMEGDGDEYQDTENLVMMEDFTNRASGLHRHIILNDTSQIQTYHLPVQLHDTETGSEAQPSLPPAPSTITSTHPLLMRQGDSHGNRSSHRGGPGGSGIRQRVRPFLPTGHANLGMSTRQPNTPVILQRLLGESTAAEILQLTSSFSSHNPGSGGPTRVLVSGDNIPIIQRPEDDLFEGLFQEPFGESSSSGSGALSCIPSTLTRWTEESKVLDGEGVHDLVTVLKPPLVEELVRRRDEELGNRKEERKKAIETAALDEKKKEAQGNTPLSTKLTNVTSSGEQALATTGMRMSTSQGGGDEQSRSNQAEMLACAMVEQVFSPLVQSSGAASTQPETVTTSTVNAAGLPNLADSSLSTPVPTLPGFVQVELTPLSNPQDRSRLYNPAAAVSSSAPGEIFTPHIGGAGLHPTQPPPPIPQFSFLNSSSGAQAASLFQHQQLQVSGTAIPMAADPSVPSGSLASLYPLGTTAAQPAESQPLIFSQASPAALNTGLWTPMNTPNVTRGSETSATTNSSHHGSMISQLLDSIFSDQAFNPHSQHATSVTPSNPAAPLAPQPMVTPSNSAIPMPLPQAPVMPVRCFPPPLIHNPPTPAVHFIPLCNPMYRLVRPRMPPLIPSQMPPLMPSQISHSMSPQIPSLMSSQIPHSMSSQMPPPMPSQMLPTMPSQIPALMSSQIPPLMSSQIPHPMSSQIPHPMSSQIPPPMSSQIPPPMSSQIPPRMPSLVPSQMLPPMPSQLRPPVPSQMPPLMPPLTSSPMPPLIPSQMPHWMPPSMPSSISSPMPYHMDFAYVPNEYRHIPWQSDAPVTGSPQRQLHLHNSQGSVNVGESGRMIGGATGMDTGVSMQQQPPLIPLSVATSGAPHNQELVYLNSMPVIPISGAPGPASATQFSSLDLAQDLSSIFPPAQQNVYGTSGSGVTGATPPLSNLNFVTTTAAASCNLVPTPLSRDGGSTVVATTTASTSTVAATSMTCSTQAAEAISIAAATASAISAPGTSSGSQDATDTEIPEGVDPSFLAALPEHIREEVILEQLRLQRIRRQAQEQSSTTATQGSGRSEAAVGEASNGSGEANTAQTMEVNPEFLAALPLAIQEEVLAQQRAEQARAQAAQQSAANPDMPVDPAIFFSTLSTTLRQQVLADMDDSMLAVLPPELAAEAQELRRDMEERHRRILQERLFAQAGFVNRLGSRYGLRGARRNPWLSGNSRLTAGAQGGTLGQSGKVKGRFMLDPEALTCLLVLLFIDEPKLNTSRLHRVLRNLCYHGPTRAWLIRALLSIVQRAGENNCSLSSATAAANSLCIEGTPAAAASATSSFKDKGKGKKSAQSATAIASSSTSFSSSSVTSIDSSMSMQSAEASSNVSSGHSQAASHQVSNPSSAAGGYWLSISLEAALGCRANVFQIHRATGGKRHAGSSAASSGNINIHPQAAPVVCRHAFDTLISLAKVFPSYFLPAGKAKEVNKCEGDLGGKEEDSGDSTGRSNASNTGPQSSPKSSRPAGEGSTPSQPAKHELKPENDVWNILLRLDGASGKSKGKGVQRSHSASTSEFEHLAVDYNGSALGQLMLMLKHPVVRRCQLLTDRLLRLLGLISDSLPDNSGRAQPAATTGATTSVGLLTGRDIRRRLATPPPVAPSPAVPATTPAAAQGGAESTNEQAPSAAAAEGTTASKDTKKAEAASETESDEDENPILYEQLKLAVEVLTSKSCSEEGLEDATSLLLQLSWANSATRAAVLELLLSGARQLGLAVCSHIHSLLEQLKELNARLSVDQVVEEESSSGEAQGAAGLGLTSGQSGKGLLQDRFSNGASIVVSAPTKLKTGRELQLPSMSQLTSKTSGQQFFLRILKVILQLREAARSAGTKNKKSSTSTSRGRGGLGFEHIHAIIDSVVSDDELLNFLGENPHTQPEIPALRHHQAQNNPPAQPPVASAAGTNQANLLGMSASTTANPSGSTTPGVEATDSRTQSSQSSSTSTEAPMEVDTQSATADNKDKKNEEDTPGQSASMSTSARLPRLSDQLSLEQLWTTLGDCLAELARTPDHHAVLILQPAVEAFFIVHAGEKDSKIGDQQQTTSKREDQLAHLNMEMAPPSPSPGPSSAGPEQPLTVLGRDNSGITMASITHLPPDTQKFLKFAETHRTVLNQILRQRTLPLAEGPFSVLVDYTRILDFDVKRRHFRQELERLNEGARREDLPVHVRRSNVFEDSFRELFRRTPEEWKQRFYIVFEGEEGQDAGGLLREWYIIISHEIFNQNYALFLTSPGDRVTYSINPSSHCNSNHLSYFKFVGRIIAKAVYDNKLLDCYFTRSFYKHMLGLAVKYTDMESEDYAFYQGLVFLLENSVEDLGYDLFFSTEIQEFGVTETRELVPNGSNTLVTNENKREYVKLVCQMKMTGAIRQQLNAFLEGFYDIIPKKLVSIFTEQELELLISGLPTIDIDELKANTEYHKYQATSLQIQWFWRALRSFDQAERANFLQFVTGTSKVPLGGFGNLEGMNGTQKFQIHRDDRSTDRLPSAHTCFNQLDLPAYETYDKLRKMLLLAISECSEGFGLA